MASGHIAWAATGPLHKGKIKRQKRTISTDPLCISWFGNLSKVTRSLFGWRNGLDRPKQQFPKQTSLYSICLPSIESKTSKAKVQQELRSSGPPQFYFFFFSFVSLSRKSDEQYFCTFAFLFCRSGVKRANGADSQFNKSPVYRAEQGERNFEIQPQRLSREDR